MRHVHCLVFLILICKCADQAAADDELRERILKEAPQAWAKVRSAVQELEGRVEENVSQFQGQKETQSRVVHEFNGREGRLLYRFHGLDESGPMTVMAINPDYSFTLERPDQKASFTASHVGADRDYVLRGSTLRSALFSSLKVGMIYVDWLAAQPGFKLLAVTALDKGDDELVQIEFTSNAFERKDYRPQGGRITLAPNLSWSVREYDIGVLFSDGLARVKGVVDYDPDSRFPVPKRHVSDVVEGDKVVLRRTWDFKDVKPGTISDDECRLTAFGLPEIKVKSGWSSWSVTTLVVVGTLCILMAVLLRRRAQYK